MDLSQFKIRSFIIGIIALGAIIVFGSLAINRLYKTIIKNQSPQKTVVVGTTPSPSPTVQKAAASQKPTGSSQPLVQNQQATGKPPASQPSTGSDTAEVKNPGISIDNISAGDTVSSPLTVIGRANVTNSKVQLEVLDQNGVLLGTAQAAACLWYNACPFSATISFDTPSGRTGNLVVYNPADNGSRLYFQKTPVNF